MVLLQLHKSYWKACTIKFASNLDTQFTASSLLFPPLLNTTKMESKNDAEDDRSSIDKMHANAIHDKPRSRSLNESDALESGVCGENSLSVSKTNLRQSGVKGFKQRSWSMLELSEMNVIHNLQDDMGEVLSLTEEEAAPASFLNQSQDFGNDKEAADADDDDDSFGFYDPDECEEKEELNEQPFTFVTRNKISELPTIDENQSDQKKFKMNVFRRMKKSVSMGMFSKHDDLDQSHHRMTTYDLHDDSLDQSNHGSDLRKRSAGISLDDSHSGRGLGSILEMDVTGNNCDNEESKVSHSRSASEIRENLSLSPSPDLVSNFIGTDDDVLDDTYAFVSKESSIKKFTPNTNMTNKTSPFPSSSSSSAFKHCGKKKPAQSILRKSSSMVDFGSRGEGLPQSHEEGKQVRRKSEEKIKRTTSFSTLEIREYHITIGDNPGGKSGPPVSLDWDYCKNATVKMCIDKYEENRAPRRARHEMYMSGSIRMWTLMKELGYSLREIESASRAADSIRKKRQKSLKYRNIHDLKYKMTKVLKIGRRGSAR